MQNSVDHFIHPEHPLKLYRGERKPWNSLVCVICRRSTSYMKQESRCPVYGCRACRFMIHLDCAKILQELSHPFHPQHSLSVYDIRKKERKLFPCSACGDDHEPQSFVYRCTECKFNLDMYCIKLMPINDGQLKLHNISHQHLIFVCNQPTDFEPPYCSFCRHKRFSKTELIYVCIDCNHLLHKSCIFPQEIMHPFHPKHSLFLVSANPGRGSNYGTSYAFRSCHACSMPLSSFFACFQCNFSLDLPCISLKPTCRSSEYDQELQNQPLKHPHPLIQCNPIKNQRPCIGCGSTIKDSVYVCLECKGLLDKSCAQLLPEITSPFHPIHPLTLEKYGGVTRAARCNVCYNYTQFLMYECRECGFQADTRCATSTKPYAMVNSRMHHHPLAFFIEPGYDWGKACKACRKSCMKYFFNCPECDYCMHLECCSSLPRVITHDSHCDPLIFTLSQIKDASDEDSDEEFYCHACENLRDLDDPTYYCKECHFVAHLHCFFPAILHGLKAELIASPNPPKPSELVPTSP